MRNTLQLDTIPSHETVSEHLLSEFEQLVHLEKKSKTTNPGGGGGDQQQGNPKKRERKFFRTEGGRRRGASCSWIHSAETGGKRCFTCGATTHC